MLARFLATFVLVGGFNGLFDLGFTVLSIIEFLKEEALELDKNRKNGVA